MANQPKKTRTPRPVAPSTQDREAFVAIVGEPNVGKSTLLNRIVSQRVALATSTPGTTRDRFYAPSVWNGIDFMMIDTAGIILDRRDELEKNVQKQAEIALDQADVLIYVVDGKQPPERVDREVLRMIRRQKKPVILAVNKCDSPQRVRAAAAEFAFTGIKNIVACSSISGVGTGDLLDEVTKELAKLGFGPHVRDVGTISVSIVGKPNVGKSSFFNAVVGEERVVVSSVPGTTRNPIDTIVTYKDQKIKIVDTAGLKRKDRKAEVPDIYAALQTVRAIRRSEICILIIDGTEHITQQDQRVAGDIVEARKGLVIAINKTDLLNDKQKEQLERDLAHFFPFLWWAPVVPISAKDKVGTDAILDYLLEIEVNRRKEFTDEQIGAFLEQKMKQNPPKRVRDERVPKIYSLRQVDTNPPVFLMAVNEPSAISQMFRKFLENSIIRELGFWGSPIQLRLERKRGNPNVKSFGEDTDDEPDDLDSDEEET
jgi:GTP-binding protein